MTLIYCPECNQEISEHSESCIKCGFPLKKFMEENDLTDTNALWVCPVCANAHFGDYNVLSIKLKCEYCNTLFIQTKENTKELFSLSIAKKDHEEYKAKIIEIAKKYGNNRFSDIEYRKRRNSIYREVENYKKEKQLQQTIKNIPHCPTCNSTNVRLIPTGKRTMSILGFGILSKNVGKTYECLNCKMKW